MVVRTFLQILCCFQWICVGVFRSSLACSWGGLTLLFGSLLMGGSMLFNLKLGSEPILIHPVEF